MGKLIDLTGQRFGKLWPKVKAVGFATRRH